MKRTATQRLLGRALALRMNVQMRLAGIARIAHQTKPVARRNFGPRKQPYAARLQVAKQHVCVSTAQQHTENQRLELERAGQSVDYWFEDRGVSGKVPAMQRPQFALLMNKIRDGETLVVSKLDRLGRDAIDVQQTVKALAERGIFGETAIRHRHAARTNSRGIRQRFVVNPLRSH